MEYRQFGKTGIEVSAIGFGCWEMAGAHGPFDESEMVAAVHRALDLGVTCFDTAQGYGNGQSERLLTRALGDRRQDVVLVTKFGIGYEHGRDSSRSMVHDAIDRSLEMLNTDFVDVYFVHWPDRTTPFDETMKALDEIVEQGKVRFIGLSNFTPPEIEACVKTGRVDVLQYGCNLFDRRMAKWIFPCAQEHGIGVMTYGSLAYGMLTGSLTEETVFDEGDFRRSGGSDATLKLFTPEVFRRNVQAVNELKEIAARIGKNLPQMALNWVLSHDAVSTALVGAKRPAEVEDNIGALGWELTDDIRAEIDRVFARYEIDTAPNKWVDKETEVDPNGWVVLD